MIAPAAPLTPDDLREAGAVFADVHDWSASAWRHLNSQVPVPTRASVLDSVNDLTVRLDQLREYLAKGRGLPWKILIFRTGSATGAGCSGA